MYSLFQFISNTYQQLVLFFHTSNHSTFLIDLIHYLHFNMQLFILIHQLFVIFIVLDNI